MIPIPTEVIKIGRIQKKIDNSTSQVFHPETETSQLVDFPDQYNNSGKYLTTNGSELAWSNINVGDSLPSQSGNAGKILTTDGSNASWLQLTAVQEVFNVDSNTEAVTLTATPISGNDIAVYHDGLRLVNTIDYSYNTSTKVISFNRAFLNGDQVVVYIAPIDFGSISSLLPAQTSNSGKYLTTNGTTASWTDIHPSDKCIVNNNASGNISLNIDTAVIYSLNITGNTTLSFTKDSNLAIYNNTRSLTLTLLLKNGGTYTISWPNNIAWSNDTAPELSSNNKYDIITLITFNSGTNWLGISSGSNYTLS